MCASENINIVSERGTMEAAAAGDHTDGTLQTSSILESAIVTVTGDEATTGPKTSGMTATMYDHQEMGVGIGIGTGTGTGNETGSGTEGGIHGCIGMCLGYKREHLGASFLFPAGLLTKCMRSVRGQIVRLLKEF